MTKPRKKSKRAKCRGCPAKVTKQEVRDWDGYCESCLEAGRNFDGAK